MDNLVEKTSEEPTEGITWEEHVRECLETEVAVFWSKATKIFFPEKSLQAPRVEWLYEVGKAGHANFSDWKNLTGYSVALNWDLATDSTENFVEFRDQVIPHEVCHLIAVLFFGLPAEQNSKGKIEYHFHGIDWQLVMRKMGKNPERTHQMDVSEIMHRMDRPFVYKCPACQREMSLTKILHGKIQKGQVRICGKCGSRLPIVFVREISTEPAVGSWLKNLQAK
jgi:predicted SprT family Zn-dependent metalloprotease